MVCQARSGLEVPVIIVKCGAGFKVNARHPVAASAVLSKTSFLVYAYGIDTN